MATEVEVKEQDSAQIVEVKGHINHLALELSLLREEVRTNTNSRRGLPGISGPAGPQGNPGRDAVIKIVQADGKIQVIDGDKVVAELVAVPGPAGKDAAPARDGRDGATGKDGRSAPSLDEIVRAVIHEVKTRL